jgi:hypothetical protein
MANIAFTRIIRVSERQLEFNFRKLPGDHQNFHADVTDHRGDRIQFSMYQDAHGNWHSTGNLLPLWIANEEKAIGEAIQEEISAMTAQ